MRNLRSIKRFVCIILPNHDIDKRTQLINNAVSAEGRYDLMAEQLNVQDPEMLTMHGGTQVICGTFQLCPPLTVRTLYDIFNGDIALPCQCEDREQRFTISQNCVVALGLTGTKDYLGDQTHQYFESVIAIGHQYKWTRIQFREPKSG